MKRTLPLATVLVLVSLVLLAGCKDDRTRISSILGKPDEFSGREVIVAGEVRKSYEVNLFIAEAGAYQLDDGTGKIWVLTRTGVPSEGQQVGLKGSVSNGLRLGGEVFGAVIREKERRAR